MCIAKCNIKVCKVASISAAIVTLNLLETSESLVILLTVEECLTLSQLSTCLCLTWSRNVVFVKDKASYNHYDSNDSDKERLLVLQERSL